MVKVRQRYMNYRDAAEYTGIHHNTLKKLADEGVIPRPIKLTRKLVRFDKVKLSMVFGGRSVEEVEALTESELMHAFETGLYGMDQIDPMEGKQGDNDDHGRTV